MNSTQHERESHSRANSAPEMSEGTPWRDADNLRSLYIAEDLTTREVGERLGCSRKTVWNWLRKHDIEKSKPWKDEERLRALRQQGMSEAGIADELDCGQATVHNWLTEFGIDTSRTRTEQPWHDEETLRELYVESEMTMDEVASKLGCGRQAIEEWIHRHGIETRSYNPETPEALQDESKLRSMYLSDGMSTYAIAEQLECAPSTVHDWLHDHGIETRTVGSQPGEPHHRWKGGVDEYYGDNWAKQRRKALQRDDYECQRCGITQSEHRNRTDIGLDVHHKTPIRTFQSTDDANTLENLVTLCRSCHDTIEPPNENQDD
ncbi:MAG: helix-turn-helix domain-containing protein [Halorubrum sp.]